MTFIPKKTDTNFGTNNIKMIIKDSLSHNDIEQFAASLSHLDQTVKQLSGRTFNFSNELVMFPKVMLSRISIGEQAMFHGVCQSEHFAFTIPNNDTAIKVNGIQVNADDSLYIMPPSEEIIALFEQELNGYHFSIDSKFLAKHLGHDLHSSLIQKSEIIRSGKTNFNSYQNFKKQLFRNIDYSLKHSDSLSEMAVLDIQCYIANAIRILFINNKDELKKTKIPYNKRHAIVTRALEYINSNNNIFLSVPDIAEQCYCSIRTLEYAFKQLLSVTPKQYLTIRRMYMIRQELTFKNCINITQVLNLYGVINQGRFSKDYFKMFGEYPKNTLKSH
ncbi:helix-turn-helix domain-containing protein [Photobacterium alginatilyticum]|uniref:AraC family transcriptional regulator n=1 Tax=Photobacterium alginatilyticum TaxID=1775171 RepID=A0ABW9YC13_9GAMM|nr:AraC family transcriptional regulator [Photobacterium alginatilyticum]